MPGAQAAMCAFASGMMIRKDAQLGLGESMRIDKESVTFYKGQLNSSSPLDRENPKDNREQRQGTMRHIKGTTRPVAIAVARMRAVRRQEQQKSFGWLSWLIADIICGVCILYNSS